MISHPEQTDLASELIEDQSPDCLFAGSCSRRLRAGVQQTGVRDDDWALGCASTSGPLIGLGWGGGLLTSVSR